MSTHLEYYPNNNKDTDFWCKGFSFGNEWREPKTYILDGCDCMPCMAAYAQHLVSGFLETIDEKKTPDEMRQCIYEWSDSVQRSVQKRVL